MIIKLLNGSNINLLKVITFWLEKKIAQFRLKVCGIFAVVHTIHQYMYMYFQFTFTKNKIELILINKNL